MERIHKIQDAVQNLSTSEPSADDNRLMWFKPTRGNPDYYRLVDCEKDGEEGNLYDIWLESEFEFGKHGGARVTIKVYLYDCKAYTTIDEREIFNQRVGGHQPTDQCLLNNLERAYPNQIDSQISGLAQAAEESAERRLES